MTHKRKVITFCFAMISLLGLLWTVSDWGFYDRETYEHWFYWSLPLIINLIHYVIFREGDTPKSD